MSGTKSVVKNNPKERALLEKNIDQTRESVFDAIKYINLVKELVDRSDQDEGLQLNGFATEGLSFVVGGTLTHMEDALQGLDNLSDEISNTRKEVDHG